MIVRLYVSDCVIEVPDFFADRLSRLVRFGAVFTVFAACAAMMAAPVMTIVVMTVVVVMVTFAVCDIAIEGKFFPHIYVQFAQANLLSTSKRISINIRSQVTQNLMII